MPRRTKPRGRRPQERKRRRQLTGPFHYPEAGKMGAWVIVEKGDHVTKYHRGTTPELARRAAGLKPKEQV